MLGVIAEFAAQDRDDAAEHRGRDVAMAPDRVEQRIARDHVAGVAQQFDEHGVSLGFEREFRAAAQHAVAARVDLDVAETVAGCFRIPQIHRASPSAASIVPRRRGHAKP